MKKFYYIIVFAVLMSCEEEVSFESGNRSLFIVDGFITDAARIHTIRLATSGEFDSKFDGGLEEPVTDATVSIENSTGESVQLQESRPGFYDTPEGYQAIAGDTYVLCITTQDEQHYQSQPQELRPSGSMGDLYYDFSVAEEEGPDNTLISRLSINFFSDFSFPEENYFYKWEWDGTYILNTTYFKREERLAARCDSFIPGTPEFCYVDEEPDGEYIRILNSNESTQLNNEKFLILSKRVDYNWKERYSIRFFQLAITEEAYNFWNDANQQKEQTGSIFDPAPAKIVGNVYNVNDQNEEVLGYFGVYGSQEGRLFIPGVEAIGESSNACRKPLLLPDERHPAYCCDCRQFDADRSKAQKPDFWID